MTWSPGVTAYIDLTTGHISPFLTPLPLVRKFLGGRGLNMYYLAKHLAPGTDPFSPDNPLIFGAGLVTGTLVPNASRCNVSARSPEAWGLGDANFGGFFGAAMRSAGFDRLIITGHSPQPCYIYLDDGRVELRPAAAYWGLNTRATQEQLRKDLGPGVQVACIGTAGENRVRFAAIINGLKNAAGRGGMGAVMGSKNLKAVVARGGHGVPVADKDGLIRERRSLTEYLQKSKVVQVLGTYGTPFLYEPSNTLGTIRTHNSQLNAFSPRLNASYFKEYSRGMTSCFGCVVHCRHRNTLGGEGPEYSTLGSLGANCGIDDVGEVVRLNNLVNDLGLDASSAGGIIAWAIELYQRGIIDKELTERELTYGDAHLVTSLIEDIAARRGFGNALAESSRATDIFGPESLDYLPAIKGLPQSDPHDCRYIKSFALGIAVASRGADHLRNRPTLDIFSFPAPLLREIYGTDIDPDPTSYRTKEVMVAYHEDIYAVVDSLGICKFVCHGFNSPHLLKHSHFRDIIRLVTGLDFSPQELDSIGKRIVDLERYVNHRQGLGHREDTLPRRYFEDEMPLGFAQGHLIHRAQFQALLSRYYALRGWDEEGRLSPERGAELEGLLIGNKE
ncbi:MAG: aldehyde ferredoxin oxidoreductase family protein [Chloroflexi bacterium]|nr:aldehyde ferredoxin oxidoreductase family protein [Chloroflexota bacterium]